jgi:hypothetical protein
MVREWVVVRKVERCGEGRRKEERERRRQPSASFLLLFADRVEPFLCFVLSLFLMFGKG